jgi:1,4-dihydroxy-2-naphthoate octaprenyltransferase
MINMNKIRLILRLARLHFLVLGFLLYLLGYLIALVYGAQPDIARFLFGYLVFSLAHLSVSFSNDYFDRFADRNSERTIFSGGSKVLVEYPELERLSLKIAVSLLVLSIFGIVFLTFAFDYSPLLLVFGSIGGLTGWFYTAPPLKFAYRGLGELATMLAVGFLMPGMGYFIASGFLALSFLPWVFPLSCYGIFFIITVELLDLESDKTANKVTFIVRWGIRKSKAISLVATILATISLLAINLSGLSNIVYLTPAVFFSLVPLTAAALSFAGDVQNRRILARQVTVNMLSMVVFIVGINGILLSQL